MSMLNLVVPGSGNDFADLGLGYLSDLDLPFRPIASYLLGARTGTTLRDQSGNGRDLSLVGAPTITGNYATCSISDCFQMPLSGAQIAALAPTGVTYAVVARSLAGAASVLLGNYSGGSIASASLCALNDAEASMIVQAPTSVSKLAVDANRGTRWNLYVGTQSPTSEKVFARRNGVAIESAATTHAGLAVGGTPALRIGGHYEAGNITNPVDIAFAAAFPFTFAAPDADALFTALNGYFTPLGMGF